MNAHFFLARCHTLHHIAHVMTTQTANGHGASAVRSFVNMWVRHSHQRQFDGDDYQEICWEFLNSKGAEKLGISADDEDICRDVESGPHPACDCGFCEGANWQ